MARGRGGEGDYSREAIVSNISAKGFHYSREAINRGTAIIRGNTVYAILPCYNHSYFSHNLWHSLCTIYYEDKTNRRL